MNLPLLNATTLERLPLRPEQIHFQDDERQSIQGGFAFVRRALLFPPESSSQPAEQIPPQLVAVKILKLRWADDDPSRLQRVCALDLLLRYSLT